MLTQLNDVTVKLCSYLHKCTQVWRTNFNFGFVSSDMCMDERASERLWMRVEQRKQLYVHFASFVRYQCFFRPISQSNCHIIWYFCTRQAVRSFSIVDIFGVFILELFWLKKRMVKLNCLPFSAFFLLFTS